MTCCSVRHNDNFHFFVSKHCTVHIACIYDKQHTLSTSFPLLPYSSSSAAKISGYVLLCIILFPFVYGSPLSHNFQEAQCRTSVYEQNLHRQCNIFFSITLFSHDNSFRLRCIYIILRSGEIFRERKYSHETNHRHYVVEMCYFKQTSDTLGKCLFFTVTL
jgi:hypothetical protein